MVILVSFPLSRRSTFVFYVASNLPLVKVEWGLDLVAKQVSNEKHDAAKFP